MNIIVEYCFPLAPQYFDLAAQFVSSYNSHPAGIDHRLVVVSNGGPPTPDMQALIDQFSHPAEIFVHDNSGYDLGAAQAVAKNFPADMTVFFGSSAYLRGPGWLARMAEAFQRHGPSHLYGSMGNDGDPRFGVFPHIRTTGFFCAPLMMNMYPLRVTRPEHRYPAEHGQNCLSEWFKNSGHKVLIVTWDQEYEWPWDRIPNGFHQGNQSALLTGDKNSCPPYYHCS
jgi:hypothetical protein